MKVIEITYFNDVIDRLKIEQNWKLFDEEVKRFNLKWEIYDGEYRGVNGFGMTLTVEYETYLDCENVIKEVNILIKKYFDNNFKKIMKIRGVKR